MTQILGQSAHNLNHVYQVYRAQCDLFVCSSLAQNCQTLLRSQLNKRPVKHAIYFLCTKATLPVQKWHLLLLCQEALLQSADCLFSFPTELNLCLSAWKEKKKNSCRWFGCLKRVLAFVQCDCSVFTSCLHTPNTPNSDVHVYFFCCSLGFFNLSSTFLAHKLLQESGQWKSFLGSPNLAQTCSCAPLTSGKLMKGPSYTLCTTPASFFQMFGRESDVMGNMHLRCKLGTAVQWQINELVPCIVILL